jgi:membrane associated rhomboid family serine protease
MILGWFTRIVGWGLFILPVLVFWAEPTRRESLRPIVQLIVITWAIHAVNAACGGGLSAVFAIRPRQIFCFPNIILSHFFHYVDTSEADGRYRNYHLNSNTIEFWGLGSLIALSDISHLRYGLQVFKDGAGLFVAVTISVALISGIGVWMFGRDRHPYFGAQGVIFGYMGFLLVYGIHVGVLKEIFSSDPTLRAVPDALEGLFRIIFGLVGNLWILVLSGLSKPKIQSANSLPLNVH